MTPLSDKATRAQQFAWYAVLLWAIGIFYHFYHSNGFFELLGQLLQVGS